MLNTGLETFVQRAFNAFRHHCIIEPNWMVWNLC